VIMFRGMIKWRVLEGLSCSKMMGNIIYLSFKEKESSHIS
jgi:hypothetical protein